ncbi:MAG: GNAT family N-acetyltransferase [Candidatus Cryptobacteroides sp.]
MARKVLYTKRQIVLVAIDIIRKEGSSNLSSRSIGKALGCSVSPIFRTYSTMEDLLADVRKEVEQFFLKYVSDVCEFHPAFKEFGMRLIRFSKLEPKLFSFMFLEYEGQSEYVDEVARKCLEQTKVECGITSAQAEYLYSQSWPYVVGLASLCNKDPGIFTEEYVSYSLSMQFAALIGLVKSGKAVENVEPRLVPEGERVFLRKWHEADSSNLFAFSHDPELLAFPGWHPLRDEAESRDVIRRVLSREASWAIALQDTGKLIGNIGYRTSVTSRLPLADDEAEVVFWIPKQYRTSELCIESVDLLLGHCRKIGIFRTLYCQFPAALPDIGTILLGSGFSYPQSAGLSDGSVPSAKPSRGSLPQRIDATRDVDGCEFRVMQLRLS